MEVCATHDIGIPERESSVPEFFLDEGTVGIELLGNITRPVAENLTSAGEKNGKKWKGNQSREQEDQVGGPALLGGEENMIYQTPANG
jgi:hypothetical protein